MTKTLAGRSPLPLLFHNFLVSLETFFETLERDKVETLSLEAYSTLEVF